MARDTDPAALLAFTTAFGNIVPRKKGKDEKIRLGKAMIALQGVEQALAWAEDCGFDAETLEGFRGRAASLRVLARREAAKEKSVMKDLDALKKQCRTFQDDIRRARAKKKIANIPEDSGIFVNDLPGLDELTPEEREAKITEVRQQVCRGSTLMGLLQGDQLTNVAPTTDTVIDLCWYLKGMAQDKLGEPFTQGALTIEDPGGKLAKLFDGCKDVYPRDSSHLRPQQQTEGSQGRGIDASGRFPAGMNTMLYHPFTTERGEKRIYLKFETAGAYGHVGDKREVFRRPKNEEDDAQSDAHARAFVSGTKDEGLKETREGTVNLAVQAAYNALYEAATGGLKGLLEPGKQKSKQNSAGEITATSRVLSFTPLAPNYWDVQTQRRNVDNLNTALADLEEAQAGALPGLVDAWEDAMRDAGYSVDAHNRLGDEVVLQQSDLKTVASDEDGEGDVDPDALGSYHTLFQERKLLQKSLLEGDRKNVPYVFYRTLRFVDANQGVQEYHYVLNLDTAAKQFEAYAAGTAVESGTITKGTNKLTRNKYFKYTGNVSKADMFNALRETGWNLANLTRADLLEKEG